jgi:hypothetical protein
MEFQNDNGTATKNGAATADKINVAQNGAAKTTNATNGKANHTNGKAEEKPEPAKAEAAKTPEPPKAGEPQKEEPKAEVQQPKEEAKPASPELTLDARLKAISDLNRKSIQRLALIGRMKELEAFEVALIEENDELESNPYQGCKLVIVDDKKREFVTVTPGLIRMVAQFIFDACEEKLNEIEAAIVFPKA